MRRRPVEGVLTLWLAYILSGAQSVCERLAPPKREDGHLRTMGWPTAVPVKRKRDRLLTQSLALEFFFFDTAFAISIAAVEPK